MNPITPTVASVLEAVSRERIFDLAKVFGVRLVSGRQTKAALTQQMESSLHGERLAQILHELSRDELRSVCRAHSLSSEGRARDDLILRLGAAAGIDTGAPPAPLFDHQGVPAAGQILNARGRQWLIEEVRNAVPTHSPLLRLACLDDDAPGEPLELLWDLEIGAQVVSPDVAGLGKPSSLDEPAAFGAYLHALKWSTVSAADPNLFQAPFRAGIKLMAHQLTPLMKALELPRANLFIADDVGLGKTIEAGLVLQELILRQQAEFVLIVCPASITLQWRHEMLRRFGLRFEIMGRQLIARRRMERGFGVNPWATHNRFIVSYSLIRRPAYRDPLLAHLGQRAEKGLLILDEAHTAAPSSASKYAVDSDTTRTVRDLAPKFDNRLFLSATPHNGHSNSFSALLEILDPVRFTRGVKIQGPGELAPVMVRRLKRDLRQLGVDKFPERVLVQIDLEHGPEGWRATESRFASDPSPEGENPEPTVFAEALGGSDWDLELSRLLARYTELHRHLKGRAKLVLVNLQKRLLSSPEAFARTLEVHARALERRLPRSEGTSPLDPQALDLEPEVYGVDDDEAELTAAGEMAAASADLASPEGEAHDLVRRMRALAQEARRHPDAKARALLAWLERHLCPTLGLKRPPEDDPAAEEAAARGWSQRRVIVFTEYGDTKRYLFELLTQAARHTHRGDERILTFHGGMGDQARDEVQQAFNAPPQKHPVRILVATDAAREGVNLQAHCADLFHYDVPWNPSRLEQRNGRLDRTLQPAPEVRSHYFTFTQRPEDRVLQTLIRKIDVVQRELGSVGAVLMAEIEETLKNGLGDRAGERLKAIGTDTKAQNAEIELEAQRRELDTLQAEVEQAAQRLERSRRVLAVDPQALQGVVEMGLRLAAGPAGPGPGPAPGLEAVETADGPAFVLPEMDDSWQPVLDTLRPPRGPTEAFWEWRRRPPKPVTFSPLATLTQETEQLHLAHPVVRRVLDRFLAQGYSAHDLSRVCAVVVPGENVPRALAYARLTLFGRGAARLHDELMAVAAPWSLTATQELQPYRDGATAAHARQTAEAALAAAAKPPSPRITERIKDAAPATLAALWPHLEAEADAKSVEAKTGLMRRGRKESDELVALLERQRQAIQEARAELGQRTLFEVQDKTQRRQIELDLRHLEHRQERMADELTREPAAIEALYEVRITRLSPVGLVIAWPEAMT